MSDYTKDSVDAGHAFLDLGERLRTRGQLDAALSVAQAGVGRYPTLAAAHELIGRIRSDQGDDDGARASWLVALECDRRTLGALKGLAFLAFRHQDFAEAERRLEAAAAEAPHDVSILAALDRVRLSRPAISEECVSFEDPAVAVLLFDHQGLHLAGALADRHPSAQADIASAAAVGVLREAERATTLLDLGTLRHLLIEGGGRRLAVAPVEDAGGVLLSRPLTTPAGRVVALADRAVATARAWLGRS